MKCDTSIEYVYGCVYIHLFVQFHLLFDRSLILESLFHPVQETSSDHVGMCEGQFKSEIAVTNIALLGLFITYHTIPSERFLKKLLHMTKSYIYVIYYGTRFLIFFYFMPISCYCCGDVTFVVSLFSTGNQNLYSCKSTVTYCYF